MNHLSTIKRRMKGAKTKISVASAAAVGSVLFGSSAFALDVTATGPIGTAITGGITDYETIFGMVLAAIVAFWALWRLQGIFFSK